ncbi:hypothetical protein Taro_006434 [Colocasia esculenta]|uniref:Uncharacterized protein n=1 Tax=Colocasia esculenta TaxID=4460 RepID=A0A843TSQ2_COLES|nr:hypothetical protein [Colocasia esculenta]
MYPERWGQNTNGRQGLLLSTCGLFKLAHGSAEWRGSVSRNAISLHKPLCFRPNGVFGNGGFVGGIPAGVPSPAETSRARALRASASVEADGEPVEVPTRAG